MLRQYWGGRVSDYTPTTEEAYIPETSDVRANYVDGTRQLHGKGMRLEDVYAEFDRWLAEVKAQAWEEGYAHGNADAFTEARLDRDNPYRQES